MFVLSLRHRVQDFDSWKTVFDERLDARLKGKVIGHRLTRAARDPREVEVVMEFASRADAEAYREYMQQPQTREALARASVEEHAPMWIGEQIEAVTYSYGASLPSEEQQMLRSPSGHRISIS